MAKFLIYLSCFVTIIKILQINTLPVDERSGTKCQKTKTESICTTPQCIHSASDILKNMNQSVAPCDDFYEFACGNFPKQHITPDDQPEVTRFSLLDDEVLRQIKSILDEPIRDDEARPFVLAKTLYNLCLDEKSIEENGIAPLQSILTRLGGWPVVEGSKWKEENFDWKTTAYNIQNEGYGSINILPISVGINAKNSSQHMINIEQGLLKMVPKILLKGLENKEVQAYYEIIVQIAVWLGVNKETASAELKDVLDFEIEIAKIIVPSEELRNMSLNVNQMTIRELQDKFDDIPWVEYINHALSNGDIEVTLDDFVDISVPSYLTNLMPLLNSTSQRVLHNYFILDVVIDSLPYLPKEIKKAGRKFEEVRSGTEAIMPRWLECVNTLKEPTCMSIAISALYVRKYFTDAAKQSAEQLVQDIRDTFNDVLEDLDWLDSETKAKAAEKEVAMKAFVAYPPELLVDKNIEEFYAKLNFSSQNYLESILKVNRFMEHSVQSKLRKPVDKTDWISNSNAINVNAYYAPQDNSILLPAGILQGVFFNNDRPRYMNYGSIGFVIGHEITHGFDDVGRQFDKNGQISEWWGEESNNLFMEKAQCFVDQYSNFTFPHIDMHINGIATQGENIADNGGIEKAYLAYEKWIERNGEEPRLPGLTYTPKQMFWISAANLYCVKQSTDNLKNQILIDPHSPNKFRVIGSLRNSDSFAKDFNCPLESNMNPSKKCKIW